MANLFVYKLTFCHHVFEILFGCIFCFLENKIKMSDKEYWFGNCKNGWVRSIDCENHFSSEKIKQGGKLVDNKCFRAKQRCIGQTLSEVEEKFKNKTLFSFAHSKSPPSTKPSTDSVSSQNFKATPEDNVSDFTCDTASQPLPSSYQSI